MTGSDALFAGSIPGLYDRHLGPLLFAPFAEEVARRAAALQPRRIIETAAGTGIVTEALHRALPDAKIVATDLNPPMLEQAARRVAAANVRFQAADAQDLPFEDASVDLVLCQFGVMFFPDKARANAEARRVLRAGGHYLLVIWDKLEHNLASYRAGQAVAKLFPGDTAAFLERVPFRYHERGVIEHDLRAAGFTDIEFETVALRSRAAAARDAAIGLVQGTPMRSDIEQMGDGALDRATDAVETALRSFEGPDGFDAPMSAHLVIAAR